MRRHARHVEKTDFVKFVFVPGMAGFAVGFWTTFSFIVASVAAITFAGVGLATVLPMRSTPTRQLDRAQASGTLPAADKVHDQQDDTHNEQNVNQTGKYDVHCQP